MTISGQLQNLKCAKKMTFHLSEGKSGLAPMESGVAHIDGVSTIDGLHYMINKRMFWGRKKCPL